MKAISLFSPHLVRLGTLIAVALSDVSCAESGVTVDAYPIHAVEMGRRVSLAFVSVDGKKLFESATVYLPELSEDQQRKFAKVRPGTSVSEVFDVQAKSKLALLPKYRFPYLLTKRLRSPTWGVWADVGYVVGTEPLTLAYAVDVQAFTIASRHAVATQPSTAGQRAATRPPRLLGQSAPPRRTLRDGDVPNFVESIALDVIVDTIVIVGHQAYEDDPNVWPLRPASRVIKLRQPLKISELLDALSRDPELETLAVETLDFPEGAARDP